MELQNNSYVYLHITADEHIPFYVGKGFGNRAYAKFRNKWWQNIVNKHGYYVEFIKTELTDEEAIILEIEMIAKIGRRDQGKGTLVNLTDGGEGTSNPSEETREKLRKNWTGRKHTEESKKKMSERASGKIKSESHRRSIGLAQTGRKQSPETVQKRADALKGITHKDKGTPMNEEWKHAISDALKGRTTSEDHKRKLSEASKAAHARKKALKLSSNDNCESAS